VYTLNTSRSNPRRFFLYDHRSNAIEREFDSSDDCCACFDLSPDGQLLAVKYWGRKHIDIVDANSGTVRFSFGPSRVWEVKFDDTATNLLVKAKSGGLSVYGLAAPHHELRIAHARDIADGCSVAGRNEYLIPCRRKGRVVHIDFDHNEVTQEEIPLKCTVKCIRHSPAAPTLFLLDSSGAVSCYDSTLSEQLWKTKVDPVPADGQVVNGAFSGNGQLIGLAVVHHSCE